MIVRVGIGTLILVRFNTAIAGARVRRYPYAIARGSAKTSSIAARQWRPVVEWVVCG